MGTLLEHLNHANIYLVSSTVLKCWNVTNPGGFNISVIHTFESLSEGRVTIRKRGTYLIYAQVSL